MANVGFKLGLQPALDALLALGKNAGATEGSFYLTSDTHRLYIGNSDGSLSPVNEGVTTVAEIGDLPRVTTDKAAAYVGRFYYVTQSNILCVFNGKAWAQINTDTTVKEVTHSLEQTAENREVTLTHTIESWDGANTVGSQSDQWSMKGTNGIYVKSATDSNGNPQFVIEGDTYSISTETSGEGVAVKLDSEKEDNDSSFDITPGSFLGEDDVNISITTDANGNIVLAAKDTSNKEVVIGSEEAGFSITIVDSHNADVKAEVNPLIKYGKTGTSEVHFVNGVATLDVYDKSDIDETLRVLNAMTYRGTIGSAGTVATSITMNDKDDPNAGCVVKKGSTTIVNVSIGDMFLCCGNNEVSYNGNPLSTNTLLIARSTDGTENAQGFIENSKLIFDVVASTVNIDTTYRLEGETIGTNSDGAKISLYDERTNNTSGSLSITTTRSENGETGLKITRTTTDNGVDGMDDVWLIEHDATEKTVSENNAYSYQNGDGLVGGLQNRQYTAKVVTGIQTNESGHVTGVTMHSMPIIDTSSQIDEIAEESDAYDANNKSYGFHKTTTTELLVTGDTNVSEDAFAFVSETLRIKTSGEVATPTGYNKSTANGLQIDLIWGTFE